MGYHRAEILGSYVSIFLIWGLLIGLNWEATNRLINRDTQPEINSNIMLITACIGFACNIINFCALNADFGEASGDDESESDVESHYSSRTAKSLASRSLHESLMAVYKPSQAHKGAKTKQKIDVDEISEAGDSQRQKLIAKHNRNSEIEERKNEGKTEENLTMKAAIVHLLGDMVQSIGVISAAIIIKFKPEW